MSEEAGFLQAIREGRTDPTPRLVYADWLDDRSDPRGEYLRLQAQLAETTARLAELGAELDPSWVAEVRWPLGYDRAFTLRTGREIWLNALDQVPTYAELRTGARSPESQQRSVTRALRELRRRAGTEPYLLRPDGRDEEWQDDEPDLGGPATRLPAVVCCGRFWSIQPARSTVLEGSALTVVWFQDEFALPIDSIIRERILMIDWESHANDFGHSPPWWHRERPS